MPWAVLFHQPKVPDVAVVVIEPEQVRLPLLPSRVQPVSPEPPDNAMVDAPEPVGPMFRVVAADKSVNVDVSVTSDVDMVGLVPNTNFPDPVSSDRESIRYWEVADVVSCPPVVVNTPRLGVRPENVIVPLDVKPVRPDNTPAEVKLQVPLPSASPLAMVTVPEALSRVRAPAPPEATVKAPLSAMLLVVNVWLPITVPVIKVPTPVLLILVVPPS